MAAAANLVRVRAETTAVPTSCQGIRSQSYDCILYKVSALHLHTCAMLLFAAEFTCKLVLLFCMNNSFAHTYGAIR